MRYLAFFSTVFVALDMIVTFDLLLSDECDIYMILFATLVVQSKSYSTRMIELECRPLPG